MYLRKILLMAVFWPIFSAAENEETLDNFNYVARISEGRQSLREFELPYEIFAGLQRRDFSDMRIINAQHQPVPFTVSKRPQPAKHNKITHTLSFYRLAETKSGNPLQLRFELKNDSSINFSSSGTEQTGQDALLIIDNNQQDYPLYKLELQWSPQPSFSIPVRLESSTDLQNWFTLRSKAVLYDLKHQNTALLQNIINIPAGTKAKYLRLAFDDTSHFTGSIKKITGEYSQTIPATNDHWKKLPALQKGNQKNEWLFNTHSLVAVTKIGFNIPQAGLFYQGTLFSKHPEKLATNSLKHQGNYKREIKKMLHKQRINTRNRQSGWLYQNVVRQYRLTSSFGEIHSDPISIHATQAYEWKLILKQPQNLLPEQIPEIKIAWEPVVVTFLAQGNGPFRLFYGNPDARAQKSLLPNLSDNNTLEKVTITDINVADKANDARQLISYFSYASSNWQKALLWILLCFGVILMTFMVYRLFNNIASGKR